MDSLQQRWDRLAPHVDAYGPPDAAPRPAVLMFHGCGGPEAHLREYGEAAAARGWRAFAIDSFAPRGWGRPYGRAFVCTGLSFWGAERAGDVLAAIHGVSQRPDVDASSLVLTGWSHGSWAIMDLMTMGLQRPQEARIAGAHPGLLDGVSGLFLIYPYLGPGSRSRHRPWLYNKPVFGLIAERDHLGPPDLHDQAYDRARAAGCEVETWRVDATHAFDQPEDPFDRFSPMKRDPALAELARGRFGDFLAARRPLEMAS